MKVWDSSREVRAHCWSKYCLRLDALKTVRGTGSPYLPHPSCRAAQLSAMRAFSAHDVPLKGKWAHVSGFPSCAGCCQRDPLHLAQSEYWGMLHSLAMGRAWENRVRALGEHQRTLHQEACPWAAAGAWPADPHSRPSGTPSAPHGSPTHPSPCGRLPVCAPGGGKYKPLQRAVSVHRQLARLCGMGRKHTNKHKLSQGKQTGGCQFLG